MIRRLIREAIIGATSSGAAGPRQETLESKFKTAVLCERHELEESLQLLNAMRAMGGVRRVAQSANCDAGAPVGDVPERIMRHTGFAALNEHIVKDTEFDPREAAQWGQYGEAVRTNEPIAREEVLKYHATPEQKRAAAENVHKPRNVRTLQEELFG